MSLEGHYRFERARPTFLENWPQALRALSVAQVDIPLDLMQANALGRHIRHFGQWFGEVPPGSLEALRERLQAALATFPEGAFVRLGSRSGKDSVFAANCGMRVHSARAALSILTDGSQRIASDLRQCIARGVAPHVFVREWVHFPPWAELRCFMRARRLVGMTQYDCVNLGAQQELAANAEAIRAGVVAFFTRFREVVHLDDVVFDVFLVRRQIDGNAAFEIRLLEINPFGRETDAGLFCWNTSDGEGDFDGTFRFLR
jgi:hypothetical protein